MIKAKGKETFIILLFSITVCFSQESFFKKSDSLNRKRKNTILITQSVLTGGALLALNELWYKDYKKSSFHFINDNSDWNQMDKIGHFMASYYLGKTTMDALDWSGVGKRKQLIYGATYGFVFLTAIEILDGFSEEWGASYGDLLANATGTGFLIGQELLWKEQRIKVKYSFHQTEFAKQRPNTFGENYIQQALKDYNGQTYWFSANIWSFNKQSNFPKWLNVALGYGTHNMLYSKDNLYTSPLNKPFRQFYLSLDVDLEKIKTKSKVLSTLFSIVNFIKIPAPAIEVNTKGQVKFHYLYF